MTHDNQHGDPGEATALDVAAQVVAHLPDYVALVDREHRFLWVNHLAPGLSLDQVVGVHMGEFLTPASRPVAAAAVESVLVTGEAADYEVEGHGVGVSAHWYRTRAVPAPLADGEPRVLLVTRDITIERRAETALRASESRFRALIDGMPDHVIELDAEHRVLYVNRYHDAGAGPEHILGKRIEDLAVPEMRDQISKKLDRLFETGEVVRWSSRSSVDPGDYLVRAVRLGEHPPTALVVATDTARERQLTARLEASEERLGRAIAAGNIAIWEVDLTTNGTSAFGALASELGLADPEVGHDVWVDRIHPDDRAATLTVLEAHRRGETEQYEAEYRFRVSSEDRWRWLRTCARIVDAPSGRVLAGTIADVTATHEAEGRKRDLERQVERVQRIESVGVLAGGIAHDFNNLLTVILATAEIALADLGRARRAVAAGLPDPRTDEGATVAHFEAIAEAASRAARLTKQLLAFSRRQDLTRACVDLVSLVQGVLVLARRATPLNVEIRFSQPSTPVHVLGDRGQLEQVLMNVVFNARDAMPHGGVVSLSIEADAIDVRVIVVDTGAGIPAEHLDRIFEPFFTTKAVGSGTGLGLSVAHGIMQQHDGDIRVVSEPGGGTAMTLRLPRLHAVTPQAATVFQAVPTGEETILLAEDEPSVRKIAERILTGAGYRVIAVEDGLEAVLEFEKEAGKFDLVLLDVVMPRLDGAATSKRIHARRPSVPVLFCSGYSASADGSLLGERLLAKPYRAPDLLGAVRDAITASRANFKG